MAFFVSLVPLAYLGAVAMGLSISQGVTVDYICLGLGFLCSLPIWGSAFGRKGVTRNRQDLLSLIALLMSYGYALLAGKPNYLWQPVALTATLLAAEWIMKAQTSQLYGYKPRLISLVPKNATVINGRELEQVATDELELGDVVLVRPGLTIPVDGYVVQGQSLVSETAITGEIESVLKAPGDWVLAGSLNETGVGSEHAPLTIRSSGIGNDLLVNKLSDSLNLENSPSVRYSNLGRIFASSVLLIVIAASLVAAGLALILGQGSFIVLTSAIAVLAAGQVAVVSLAAPLAAAASSIKSVKLGVIVRDRTSFEQLAKVNHVIFNKTGIITQGYARLGSINLARNTSIGTEEELLALAAAVEMGTSHELGHLIIQEAAKRGLELPAVNDIAPIPGLGVSARFDGSLVQVGNAGMVNVSGINMNPYDLFKVSSAYQEGSSVVFVSIDELLVGYLEFPDFVRPNSQQAIVNLSSKHAITLLSGDATGVVEKVATGLGLSEYAAEVLSTRKADWIKERRASGSRLLLVADGKYDAAALAEADVALAFGAGHDVHVGSANLIQVSQDPLTVSELVALSRKVQSRTFRNIVAGTLASIGLVSLAFLAVPAPVIALAGVLVSWWLTSSIVRLSR